VESEIRRGDWEHALPGLASVGARPLHFSSTPMRRVGSPARAFPTRPCRSSSRSSWRPSHRGAPVHAHSTTNLAPPSSIRFLNAPPASSFTVRARDCRRLGRSVNCLDRFAVGGHPPALVRRQTSSHSMYLGNSLLPFSCPIGSCPPLQPAHVNLHIHSVQISSTP
jgi:hypothetical protein